MGANLGHTFKGPSLAHVRTHLLLGAHLAVLRRHDALALRALVHPPPLCPISNCFPLDLNSKIILCECCESSLCYFLWVIFRFQEVLASPR